MDFLLPDFPTNAGCFQIGTDTANQAEAGNITDVLPLSLWPVKALSELKPTHKRHRFCDRPLHQISSKTMWFMVSYHRSGITYD